MNIHPKQPLPISSRKMPQIAKVEPLAGTFVRLAWHCAGTYSKADGSGGSNGGRMIFLPEKTGAQTLVWLVVPFGINFLKFHMRTFIV